MLLCNVNDNTTNLRHVLTFHDSHSCLLTYLTGGSVARGWLWWHFPCPPVDSLLNTAKTDVSECLELDKTRHNAGITVA